MEEIINTVGTLITIVVLIVAMVLLKGYVFLLILDGISLGYVICFHDRYLKYLWSDEEKKKKDGEIQKE